MITVVGTFLWYNDKFLIIQRHPDKPQGGTWGLPAGKVDAGEGDEGAAIRELQEETGAIVSSVKYMSEINYQHEGQQPIRFVSFESRVGAEPEITIRPQEISNYRWVTAKECFELPDAILGFQEVLVACKYIH